MSHTPIRGFEFPGRGERVVITFPKSKSGSLWTYVLDHMAETRTHILLAAPLLEGEVAVVAKGEALLMRWQSEEGMHSLAGTVDSFVDIGTAAWRVVVGEVARAGGVGEVSAVGEVERAGAVGEVSAVGKVERAGAVGEVQAIGATNRRRHVRVGMQGHVDVFAAGIRHSVEAVDISESGIRCRWRGNPSWVPFQRNSSVMISLDVGSDRPITLTGSILRVRPGGQGVEFSVAFTRLDESPKKIQLLRRYVLTLERKQLRRSQSQ